MGCRDGEPPETVVRAFIDAGHRGDVVAQLAAATPADRNGLGQLVLDQVYPDDHMEYFAVDSVVQDSAWADTARWIVWGTGPNWGRLERFTDYILKDYTPTKPEILALPRVTTGHVVYLVRVPGEGWRVALEAPVAGRLLALRDSIVALCPSAGDPRACRRPAATASRLAQQLRLLQDEVGFVENVATRMLREAGVMDSLSIATATAGRSGYGYTWFTDFTINIENRSSHVLRTVAIHVRDSEGRIVDQPLALDVKARGVTRFRTSMSGTPTGPFTYSIRNVTLAE